MRRTLELSGRLKDIPEGGWVRGVWFSMAHDHVKRLGRAEALAWRSAIPNRKRVPFLQYSEREFVEELAIAAAIVNPEDPAEGARKIWRDAASMYTNTAFGRSLMRLLRPGPTRCLNWLANHRDHFCNYGRWQVVQHAEGYATMEMAGEFIWIESAQRGGAEGLLRACGVDGTVEPELTNGPYEGRLHIRWRPHN